MPRSHGRWVMRRRNSALTSLLFRSHHCTNLKNWHPLCLKDISLATQQIFQLPVRGSHSSHTLPFPKSWRSQTLVLDIDLLFLICFYYVFSSITFPMISQKSPIPSPTLPYPPIPKFWPWRSPVLGYIKFVCPMGLSFQWWLIRPSFDTYAARDKSSGVLVGSYCCSTYSVAVPLSSLGTFSSSSIGGRVTHPLADCEHPLCVC